MSDQPNRGAENRARRKKDAESQKQMEAQMGNETMGPVRRPQFPVVRMDGGRLTMLDNYCNGFDALVYARRADYIYAARNIVIPPPGLPHRWGPR
jgi:hypothetical protein